MENISLILSLAIESIFPTSHKSKSLFLSAANLAKEWIVLSSQNEINQIQYSVGGSYVGEGNLFYVTGDCKLGSSNGGITNPPEFPQ